MEKFLLEKRANHTQSGVLWNIMSSGLNSVVSILLLLVVTRINGPSDAGVFSLAFSTAQMMLSIGNYGMRNYQATDIRNKYTLHTYLASRIVTSLAMVIFTGLFVLIRGYYLEKILIFMGLCLLKVTDAFDDVYGGYFQNQERLDIGGKILFIRVAVYCTVFTLILLISENLMLAIGAATIISALLLIWMVFCTRKEFVLCMPRFEWKKILRLLIDCFPLCLGAFLLVYLCNAPKYAIDTYLPSDMQAYYTYLFMPCFVINLFVSFALQPILVRLSVIWNQKKHSAFLKITGMIYLIALGISIVIVLGGRWLGCFLLGIVFGTDLMPYKDTLTILLIGGGFYSLAVIGQVILTIMRHQYATLLGFGISSAAALILSSVLVKHYELTGAAYAYTISTALLFLLLLIFIIIYYHKEKDCCHL